MKAYKVQVVPKTGLSFETVVQAKTQSDVKKIVEAQYGNHVRVGRVSEIK